MKTVEIFKTNVQMASQADALTALLLLQFPDCKINFDLQDCDKVLRIEGEKVSYSLIEKLVKQNGFQCQVLE